MKNELLEKVEKGFILSIVLSVVVYAVFFVMSDGNEIINALSRVGVALLIMLLLLSLLNYALRFYRWHLLLKNAKIKIRLIDSLKSFLSGLCLTITPGKAGELFKSSFVKKYTGASRLKTMPIVVLERVFDLTGFAAILLLSLLFVSFEDYTNISLIVSCVVFVGIIGFFLLLKTRFVKKRLVKLVQKINFLKKREVIIKEVLDDYSSISMRTLFSLILISFLGWFFEVVELYLLLGLFGANASLFTAGFVFGFSSLVGLLFFTPGGIGGFEGTSYSLLVALLSVTPSIATVITLIIRLTTLWFAVLIGLITYLKFLKK